MPAWWLFWFTTVAMYNVTEQRPGHASVEIHLPLKEAPLNRVMTASVSFNSLVFVRCPNVWVLN